MSKSQDFHLIIKQKTVHKTKGMNKLIKYNLHFSKYIPKIYLILVPV